MSTTGLKTMHDELTTMANELPEYEPLAGVELSAWDIKKLSPARFFENEPEPFEFIIPGLLARGLVGFLYGEGGAYKSLAALWLVLQRATAHINASQKWLDKFDITPGRSIFLSAEDVENDLHHRVCSIARAMHEERIPEESIQRAITENSLIMSRSQWCADGEIFLVDEDGRDTGKGEKIIELVSGFKADLVVVETYSRIAAVDEIKNELAARVVGVLEHIRDETGATIICVSHTSKMNRGVKTDTHGQNGLRGAGALLDNARWGLWFRAGGTAEGLDTIEIINSKSFRCKRVEPFTVSVEYPCFRLVEDAPAIDVFDLVVSDVRGHPGTKQRETRQRLGLSRTAVNGAFRDAVDEGLIYMKGTRYHNDGYFPSED